MSNTMIGGEVASRDGNGRRQPERVPSRGTENRLDRPA